MNNYPIYLVPVDDYDKTIFHMSHSNLQSVPREYLLPSMEAEVVGTRKGFRCSKERPELISARPSLF